MRELVSSHVAPPQLPPTGPLFAAYLGDAACPAALRDHCAAISPGAHEVDAVDGELWIARVPLAGRSEPLFVVYDRTDDTFGAWLSIVFAGAVVIWIGGTLLGVWTARRVTAPLAKLAAAVTATPPDQLADLLGAREFDEEIQALADRLRVSVGELAAYARREQRFTRYGSHELRSPVAVIRGAAELLAATPEGAGDRVGRPLRRIERAAADMETIIESFLWLARGRVAGEPAPAPTPLEPIVERVLERHEHLLVADTGPGLASEEVEQAGRPFVRGDKSAGFGLGLDIVRSLCERFGWRFHIQGGVGSGTRALLEFSEEPTATPP